MDELFLDSIEESLEEKAKGYLEKFKNNLRSAPGILRTEVPDYRESFNTDEHEENYTIAATKYLVVLIKETLGEEKGQQAINRVCEELKSELGIK